MVLLWLYVGFHGLQIEFSRFHQSTALTTHYVAEYIIIPDQIPSCKYNFQILKPPNDSSCREELKNGTSRGGMFL
jgi:hypothetical protein